MRYRFAGPVTVEGMSFDVGTIIEAKDIPAGSLQSCLYVGHLVPVEERKQEPVRVEPAKQTAAKK